MLLFKYVEQKGISLIAIILLVTILSALCAAIYLRSTSINKSVQNTPLITNSSLLLSPFPSAINEPDVLNKIVPFNTLPVEENNVETTTFTDNFLKVSFNYPKNYFVGVVEASEKDPLTIIYFVSNDNEENKRDVLGLVQCQNENRKDPSGICIEGLGGDIDIFINRGNSEKNEDCIQEVISADKTITTCSQHMYASPYPESIGTSYMVSFKGDQPIHMTIKTLDAIKNSQLIREIILSAKKIN